MVVCDGQVVLLILPVILPRTDLPVIKNNSILLMSTTLAMVILVHVEEDVASALSLLSDVLFPGLRDVAVIVAPPHSLSSTAHVTDVVPCSSKYSTLSPKPRGKVATKPIYIEVYRNSHQCG